MARSPTRKWKGLEPEIPPDVMPALTALVDLLAEQAAEEFLIEQDQDILNQRTHHIPPFKESAND